MIGGKTVFITGGAGFIGSALAGRLVDCNRVVIYDNLSRNSLNGRPFKDHPNITLVKDDVLDFEHLCRAMDGARSCLAQRSLVLSSSVRFDHHLSAPRGTRAGKDWISACPCWNTTAD